ncbi:MAG TPA: radical SAM protein [bacterium]|nr:radical SAM protein [bacterium]
MVKLRSFIAEVTTRCNHQCLHCYNVWESGRPYPRGELSTAETQALYGKMLDETGATLVTLTGGEPLLRADLPQLVGYCAGRGATVNLITNGTLVDDAALGALAGPGIGFWELPLLSAKRAIHDEMSGMPGAFDKVTLAIAKLKAKKQRVVAVFVATRLNLPTLRDTIGLAVALGADGMMFNRFNPGGRGWRNFDRLSAPVAELQAALDTAEELSAAYHFPISCSIPMPPCVFSTAQYKQLTFGFCAAGTERAYYTLDPLGNVRPCNHSATIIGNLREQPFATMVRGNAMREFLAALPEQCRSCAHADECRGCCKAAGESCCGDPRALDPFIARALAAGNARS